MTVDDPPVTFLRSLSIRIRLFLVAGVPVIGAVALAVLIVQNARAQASMAASLGSVEDLPRLSSAMTASLRALQAERALAALREGLGSEAGAGEAQEALERQFERSDAASAQLEAFLNGRDLTRLPPRLARDLTMARRDMGTLAAFRARLAEEAVPVEEVLGVYGRIDKSLVAAMAALPMLSDDGEILRSLSALVALTELSERESAEHALLASVAAQRQFPAGSFKTLVTLVTEQAIYAEVFRSNASDDLVRRWDGEQHSEAVTAALALREQALTSTSETVEIDALRWFEAEGARIAMLERVEDVVTRSVASAATHKVEATQSSIRLSVGLSAVVLVMSAFLALFIGRGMTRPIRALAGVAAHVQRTKDFSLRAEKTSADEVGALTDTFNEMLAGIEARDGELLQHRGNLEALVTARTKDLEARNEAMRIVLDNVEQGLAMVRVDGTFDGERSAKFDALLGAPRADAHFAHHVSPCNEGVREMLELGWETARDGFFPVDVALDQLPKRIEREGRHLTLAFRPFLRGEALDGALLVVTDVTAEIEARRDEERQREYVGIFERVAQDRDGFAAFAAEMGALLDVVSVPSTDRAALMAVVHTVKGNAAQWGVSSVAQIAHDLESRMVETGEAPTDQERMVLLSAWDATLKRFRALSGRTEGHLEIQREELDELLSVIWARASHEVLADKVERLRHEATAVRFQRMELDIERLADRLGKSRPRVVVEPNGVRLPAARFGSFWASMVHVIRNVVDHGIEPADQRKRAGKPETACVTLRATESAGCVRIECSDDGAGIDWSAVAEKARAAGLPSATQADLHSALFAPGVSTARRVSDVSGRGVGLAAVLERCQALGGTATVSSTRGAGTLFAFTFPRHASNRSTALPLPLQRAC